jgi:PAS domain S-box-containing protein
MNATPFSDSLLQSVGDRTESNSIDESRQLLQLALDNLPQRVLWKDRDSRFLGCNRAFAQDYGLEPAQIIGQTDWDICCSEMAERYVGEDHKVLQEGWFKINQEQSLRTPDGKMLWVRTTKRPLYNEQGEIVGIFGSYEDVTDRKRTHDIVQNIAAGVTTPTGAGFFQSFVRSLSEIVDVEFAFVAERVEDDPGMAHVIAAYGDRQTLDPFEYPLAGTPCDTLVAPQPYIYSSHLQQTFPDDAILQQLNLESYIGIPLFSSTEKSQGWISLMSRKPMEDNDFRLSVLQIFAAYASTELERRAAEQSLKTSEIRYRGIVEHQNDLIVRFDANSVVLFANEAFCRYFGITRESIIGQTFRHLVYEPDLPAVMDHVAALSRTNLNDIIENRVHAHDGVRWTQWSNGILFDAQDCFFEYQSVGRDITTRKQAEEALAQEYRRSQLFAEVALRIRQSLKLEEILKTTVIEVQQILLSDRVLLFKLLPDGTGEVVEEAVSPNWIPIRGQGIVDPCFNSGYTVAYQQGRVGRLDDTTTTQTKPCYIEMLQKFQVQANLVVPVLQGSDLWGLLIAHQCDRPRTWIDAEVNLLQKIATQVGIAIQQSQLYEQTQQQARRAQMLNRVIQSIRQSLDLTQIFDTATTEIARALDAERAMIYQYTEERDIWRLIKENRQHAGLLDMTGFEVSGMDNSLSGRLRRFEVVQIQNTDSLDSAEQQRVAQLVPGAWLLMPIAVNQSLWGALSLVHPHKGFCWTAEQVELAQSIVDQLAIAIQQANLYDRAQREVEERKRAQDDLFDLNQKLEQRVDQRTSELQQSQVTLRQRLERERLTLGITQRIRASLDLNTILDSTVNEIQQVLRVDRVLVYRINPDATGKAIAEAVIPNYPKVLNVIYPEEVFPVDAYQHYIAGRFFALNDRTQDPILPCLAEFLEKIQVQAKLVVPIVQKDQLWGLLIAHQCAHPRYWQKWESDLLRQIAYQLSIAIQQADLYEQVQSELSDRKLVEDKLRTSLGEKEILLKEIHHRVKNNLQLISSLLNLQSQKIQDVRMLEPFQDSQHRIRVMAMIHEHLYRSTNLARINFSQYVESLTHSLFQSYLTDHQAIALKVAVTDVELGIDVAIPCGLIISELVSNSIKYAFPEQRVLSSDQAYAGRIDVEFYTTDHAEYVLLIQDNGIGIPPAVDVHNTDSLGLQIVCDLTTQLDGLLQLERSQGTTFKITLPME